MLPQHLRVVLNFFPPVAIGVCNVRQKTRKSGPSVAIVGRKVRAAVKGFAVGKQENRQRPAAAAGHHLNGVHVDLIEIRTFFAIDLDVDEVVVHQLGDGLVFERLVLHHVTPVTGGVADAEQNRLVFLLARASASSAQAYQSTGLWACCRRYGLVSSMRRFGMDSVLYSLQSDCVFQCFGSHPEMTGVPDGVAS